MAILEILFYILLVIFPFGVIPRLKIISPIFLSLFDVVLFIIIVAFIISCLIKKKKPRLPFFAKDLLLFIGLAFLSLILNLKLLTLREFLVSFLYLFRFIVYSLGLSVAFFSLHKTFKKRYIFNLSISGFTFVLFGIIQYFYYPSLKNLIYLGWDEHLYRIFSTFFDPNFAGSIFLLEIVLLLSLFREEFSKSPLRKIYFFLAIPLSLLAFFLTYSRSSYFSLLAGMILFLFVSAKKRIFLFFVLIFILGLFFVPKNLMSEGVHLFRTVSIENRVDQYKNALAIFYDHPVFGIGFDSYRYIQGKYGYLKEDFTNTHSGSGVPNSFLLVAVTTGIIGLFLFLKFLTKILIKSYLNTKVYFSQPNNAKAIKNEPYMLIFFFISVIAVQSLFENVFFFPFVMFWIFIILSSPQE